MKCFFSYIKYNFKWFAFILGSGVMMTAIMFLNEIPAEEIFYGLLLMFSFLLVMAATGYSGYYKKYRRLTGLEQSVTVTLKDMTETAEVTEAQYQRCVERLFSEKARVETECIRRERDMTEYFTMWVHQIKTPIAALRLLLQEEREETEVAMGRAEELQELFRIEQYVEMALQYMRLGSESTDFVLKKVNLDDVIREAVHKYARQFISKKIALNYEAVNQTIVSDEKWLEFVIEQLLSNALKYTQKGSITIRLEECVGSVEEKTTEDAGQEFVSLVIEDTGIGIHAADLPRVCEKGYTGYNGHEDKRSTGIGLYLCNSILKKLNHTLNITSETGKGTKVTVILQECKNREENVS